MQDEVKAALTGDIAEFDGRRRAAREKEPFNRQCEDSQQHRAPILFGGTNTDQYSSLTGFRRGDHSSGLSEGGSREYHFSHFYSTNHTNGAGIRLI